MHEAMRKDFTQSRITSQGRYFPFSSRLVAVKRRQQHCGKCFFLLFSGPNNIFLFTMIIHLHMLFMPFICRTSERCLYEPSTKKNLITQNDFKLLLLFRNSSCPSSSFLHCQKNIFETYSIRSFGLCMQSIIVWESHLLQIY